MRVRVGREEIPEREALCARARALGLVALALLALSATTVYAGESDLKEGLRRELHWRINEDRAARDLPPLILDQASSDMAAEYCRQQIRNRTTGHYSVDGLAPYARYSIAGENGALRENLAAWSSDTPFTAEMLPEMIRRSHEEMLGEEPPDDGHRQAILDPHATHVGIGLAWKDGEFRLAEIFVRRLVDWSRALPRTARVADHPWGAGRIRDGLEVDSIVVHYEPTPRQLSVEEANRRSSYSLPKKRSEYRPVPHLRSPEARAIDGGPISRKRTGDFSIFHDGSFSFDVDFDRGDGIYTVVIWLIDKENSERVAASNVSIRVGSAVAGGFPVAGGR